MDRETIEPFDFYRGSSPLLISLPHNGSWIPPSLRPAMTDSGLTSRDTDWFLDRLYSVPQAADSSRIIANYSRYVIDLNRPRDDHSLYPGQITTGLVPVETFDGHPVYRNTPDAREIRRRIDEIWAPYHENIAMELDRIRSRHGLAILLDAHSIASRVPRLFDGQLPDFNFGTNYGVTCDSELVKAMMEAAGPEAGYSQVLNGRFVGGFITRNFGNPSRKIHSIQIELSQRTYLDEATREWSESRAADVQPVINNIVAAILKWAGRK